jgi:hypothetical protein
MIFLIASQVAKIISMNHQHLAQQLFLVHWIFQKLYSSLLSINPYNNPEL